MSIYMGVGALLLILAILGRKLWASGHYIGLTESMDVAYGQGTLDGFRIGDARGYTRGYSQACLDHVLAPLATEAQHYAGIVGQLPDAEDSAAFWEAVRNIHEHAGEEQS